MAERKPSLRQERSDKAVEAGFNEWRTRLTSPRSPPHRLVLLYIFVSCHPIDGRGGGPIGCSSFFSFSPSLLFCADFRVPPMPPSRLNGFRVASVPFCLITCLAPATSAFESLDFAETRNPPTRRILPNGLDSQPNSNTSRIAILFVCENKNNSET